MDVSPAEDAARLALSDVFNAQAAQATHQRLVDVINAQAAAVERLARRVATLETTQRHTVAAQQLSLQQLDATVAQLERLQESQAAMEATRRAETQRVDAMVAATEARVERECVGMFTRLEEELRQMKAKMREELASTEFVNRLQDDQFAVHDRITAIETRVDGKLDKFELTRLDSVVAKIHSFAPTATQLSTRVSDLEEARVVARQQRETEAQKTQRLSDHLSNLELAVEKKVDRGVWNEFVEKEFAEKITQLRDDSEATQSLVGELVHRGVALETSYRTLTSKLTSVASAMTRDFDLFRDTIQANLGKKPDRDEVESTLKEVRRELSCKAWRKDIEAINEELAHLKIQTEDMERHVELSTRFLDWFAKRGESYERNLDVVEQQLDRLALASVPQLRGPFDGQVRFPH